MVQGLLSDVILYPRDYGTWGPISGLVLHFFNLSDLLEKKAKCWGAVLDDAKEILGITKEVPRLELSPLDKALVKIEPRMERQ